MSFSLLLVLLLVLVLAMYLSARRFAAKARRAGRWNAEGPLVETAGPEHRVRNAGMEERLEVIGEWDPPVTHDRRHETRQDVPSTDEATRGEG